MLQLILGQSFICTVPLVGRWEERDTGIWGVQAGVREGGKTARQTDKVSAGSASRGLPYSPCIPRAGPFQQTPVSLSDTSLPLSCTCTALSRSLLIPKQVNAAPRLGLGFPSWLIYLRSQWIYALTSFLGEEGVTWNSAEELSRRKVCALCRGRHQQAASPPWFRMWGDGWTEPWPSLEGRRASENPVQCNGESSPVLCVLPTRVQ